VAPEEMVIFPANASELIVGWSDGAEGIVTSSALVGTAAQDQFPAVPQSVLVAPVHVQAAAKAFWVGCAPHRPIARMIAIKIKNRFRFMIFLSF
jgi:hypothetical protein